MFLAGLQKLSLLDFPGLVACTVFTGGCNLRCPFCHNAGLVVGEGQMEELPADEFLSFLRKRQGILDGVCVSGGEPLLHTQLPALLREIRQLGFRVKLDTNGAFPDRLKAVVEEGLADKIAMDIKNGPSRYAETTGIPGLDAAPFGESKDFLLKGGVDYEFRTTVVRGLHTEESLLEAASWIRGAKVWYLQQFRDSGHLVNGKGLSAFSEEEMRGLLVKAREVLPTAELRGL